MKPDISRKCRFEGGELVGISATRKNLNINNKLRKPNYSLAVLVSVTGGTIN